MMSVNQHGSLYDLQDDRFSSSPRTDFYLDLQQEKLKQLKPNYSLASSQSLNLSLNTPDITTLLSDVAAQSSSITTQAPTPNSFFRSQVTQEQEMYAQGFLQALDELHTTVSGPRDLVRAPTAVTLPQQEMPRQPAAGNHHKGISSAPVVHHHLSSPPIATCSNPTLEAVSPYVTATLDFIPNIPSSQPEATSAFMSRSGSTSLNYATNSYPHFSNLYPGSQAVDAYNGYNTAISSAAHIMPALPSSQIRDLQNVVPADMHTQEQMKEERKKARNRLAASKCRLRRLQRESELQGKVRVLKEHNQELNSEVTDLRDQITSLKRALIQHMKGGCHVNFPEGYVLDSTA